MYHTHWLLRVHDAGRCKHFLKMYDCRASRLRRAALNDRYESLHAVTRSQQQYRVPYGMQEQLTDEWLAGHCPTYRPLHPPPHDYFPWCKVIAEETHEPDELNHINGSAFTAHGFTLTPTVDIMNL